MPTSILATKHPPSPVRGDIWVRGPAINSSIPCSVTDLITHRTLTGCIFLQCMRIATHMPPLMGLASREHTVPTSIFTAKHPAQPSQGRHPGAGPGHKQLHSMWRGGFDHTSHPYRVHYSSMHAHCYTHAAPDGAGSKGLLVYSQNLNKSAGA